LSQRLGTQHVEAHVPTAVLVEVASPGAAAQATASFHSHRVHGASVPKERCLRLSVPPLLVVVSTAPLLVRPRQLASVGDFQSRALIQ